MQSRTCIQLNTVRIPKIAKEVMKILIDQGHEVYLVGGSVRDLLMNNNIHDFDFATSATPEEMKAIFKRKKYMKIMNYGEKHGTIGVYYKKRTFEFTTFREEDNYSDGRRPDNVTFVKDLRTDLSRRDFTINALAVDIEGRIIDYFNGIDDFSNKIIRAVGNPDRRFSEDSLRVLRAVRFALRLDFEIEAITENSIKKSAELLRKHAISGERILIELSEIFKYTSKCFATLHRYNIFEVLFPEYDLDAITKLISISEKFEDAEINSWIVLFHFISNKLKTRLDFANKVLKRYPGKGKYFGEYIQGILYSIDYLEQTISTPYPNALGLILFKMVGKLKRFEKFKLEEYIATILNTFNVIYEPIPEEYLTEIELFVARYEKELAFNGNMAKKIGFKGKSINSALTFAKYLQVLLDIHDARTYEEFIVRYCHSGVINLLELESLFEVEYIKLPRIVQEMFDKIVLDIIRMSLNFKNQITLKLKSDQTDILTPSLFLAAKAFPIFPKGKELFKTTRLEKFKGTTVQIVIV